MLVTAMLLLQTDPGLAGRAADILQYLIGAGIIAMVALNIRTAMLVNSINTVLREPEIGLVSKVGRQAVSIAELRSDVNALIDDAERPRSPS